MSLPEHAGPARSSRAATERTVASVAAGAALVAAVVGLCGLSLHPDATNRLRDDAFYEFAWAANVASGRGPTVSDGVPTSGVQLLWSVLLVPIVWLGGAAALPVVAPWLGFALHLLTAAVWWRGCRDRLTGWCVAACWLGHPLLVRESQNGQETALACLFASLLWLRRRTSEPWFVLLGVGAVFARSELLLLVAALSWQRHRSVRAAVAPAVASLAFVVVNVSLAGSILPDSAAPMAWLWHTNAALVDPSQGAWLERVWWYLRPALLGAPFANVSAFGIGLALFVAVRAWWPRRLRVLPLLLVGGAALAGANDVAVPACAALLLALLPAAQWRPRVSPLLPLFAALAGIVVLHWAVRWYPRDYYLAPLAVVAFAAAARMGRVRVLLLVFAAAQCVDAWRARPEPLAGQAEFAMAGRFLGVVLEPGERIGCFNAGLVTFHADVLAEGSERHPVVNLDGVVDARSFAALRDREIAAHLDSRGVHALLDNPTQFALDARLPHANGMHFGAGFDPAGDLIELARFDVPGVGSGRPGSDDVRLYWRRGRGEPPSPATAPRELGRDADGARYVLWPAQRGETLQTEAPDGTRVPLVRVDAGTQVVVRVPREAVGTRRLFVGGSAEPVLVLQAL